jgi:hypothetical protein
MPHTVIISDAAEADLFAICVYIEARAGNDVAFRFVERIEAYCPGLPTSRSGELVAMISAPDCVPLASAAARRSCSRSTRRVSGW